MVGQRVRKITKTQRIKNTRARLDRILSRFENLHWISSDDKREISKRSINGQIEFIKRKDRTDLYPNIDDNKLDFENKAEIWKELKYQANERNGVPIEVSYRDKINVIKNRLNEVMQLRGVFNVKINNVYYTASKEQQIPGSPRNNNFKTVITENKKIGNVEFQVLDIKDKDELYKAFKISAENSMTDGDDAFDDTVYYNSLSFNINGRIINKNKEDIDFLLKNTIITREIVQDTFNIPLRANEYPKIWGLSGGIQISNQKCVLNFLYTYLTNNGNRTTLKELENQLESDTPSLNMIIKFLDSKNIPYHFKDSFGNILAESNSKNGSNYKSIYAVVANEHIYSCDKPVFQDVGEVIHAPYTKKNVKIITEYYPDMEDKENFSMVLKYIENKMRENVDIIEFLNTNNFNKLVEFIYNFENRIVENIKFISSRITQFSYKDIFIVVKNSNVKNVINAIEKANPMKPIVYKNQSMGELAQDCCSHIIKHTSTMNKEVFDSFVYSTPNPQNKVLREFDDSLRNIQCIDIRRCYTSCLYTRDEPLYMLSINDSWEPYEGKKQEGYYYVVKEDGINLGPFELGCTMIFRSNTVIKLLELNIIEEGHIKYYLKPYMSVSSNIGKEVIDYIYSLDLSDDIKKNLFNSFNGSLGIVKRNYGKHILTNSQDAALGLFIHDSKNNIMKFGDNLFKVSYENEEFQYSNNRNIYHDVVIDGIFRLYDLYNKMNNPKSILIGYKTDSITMVNPNNVSLGDNWGDYKKEAVKHLPITEEKKNYYIQPKLLDIPVWNNKSIYNDDNSIDINCVKAITEKFESFCLLGKAGTGKTSLIKNLNLRCIALGLSHQIRIRLSNEGLNSMTLASFFHKKDEESYKQYQKRLLNKINGIDYLIVDEFIMVGFEYLQQLYELQQKTNIKYIFIGDYRQIGPIQGNYDNHNLDIVKEMCDYNLIELNKMYRSDVELDAIATKVYNQEAIQKRPFELIKQFRRVNICYTNNRRKIVNAKCFNHFRNGAIIDGSGYYVDVPLICKKKNAEFMNGDMVVYKGDFKIEFNGVLFELNKEILKDCFELGYCMTIHKKQGSTITEDFNIYELNLFDNRMAYTALTRAKNMNQIHVDSWSDVFKSNSEREIVDMTSADKKHCIYALYDTNVCGHHGIFYIGQTNNIDARLAEHREDAQKYPDRAVYSYANKLQEWNMKVIYKCSSIDVDEAEKTFIDYYLNKLHCNLQNFQLAKKKEVKVVKEVKNVEAQLKLKGCIKNKKSEQVIVFEVSRKKLKKLSYKTVRTFDEAMAQMQEIQRFYSIHGVIPGKE